MSPDDALRLCRIAKSISPAQAVDKFTPEAWALVLRNVRLRDAEEALSQLGGEQEFVHVSHIVQRVKRIRRDRVNDYGPLPQPPASIDPDNVPALQRWLKATTTRIADGDMQPDLEPVAALPERPVIQLGQIGTHVPSEERADLRQQLAAIKAARKVVEPEPLLHPSEYSREPEPDHSREPEPASTEETK